MTTERPKLYPGHQHQWVEHEVWPISPRGGGKPLTLVRCKICEWEVARSLANLDGAMLNDAVYDEPDTEPPGCREHDYCSPETCTARTPDTDQGAAT